MWHWLQSKVWVHDPRVIRALCLSLLTTTFVLILLFFSFEPRLFIIPATVPKAVYIVRPLKKQPAARVSNAQKPQPRVQKKVTQRAAQLTKKASVASASTPKVPAKKPAVAPQQKKDAVKQKPVQKKQEAPAKIPIKKEAVDEKASAIKSPPQKEASTHQKPLPKEEKKPIRSIPSTPIKKQAQTQVKVVEAPNKIKDESLENAFAGISVAEMPATKYEALYEAIAATWRPPKGLADGSCAAQVSFDRYGHIKHVEVMKTSGMVVFDMAVRAALWRAQYPRWVANQTITVMFGDA